MRYTMRKHISSDIQRLSHVDGNRENIFKLDVGN